MQLKKQGTRIRAFPPKTVALARIKKFWKEWQNPEKARQELLPGTPWHRKVLALSPTTLATVRRFRNPEEARQYVINTLNIERTVREANPKKFALQQVQFFSRKGNLLLERVYPAQSVDFVLNVLRKSRHSEALKRKLKRKGINLNNSEHYLRFEDAVQQAYEELLKIEKTKLQTRIHPVNILVLDFDPATSRVLFAIIDHELPPSIKE
ncbi:MAG: hypothetical protein WC634_05130 [archaeon]